MHTIQELQAFDFLLKKFLQNNSYALSGKNLKLVLRINGELWSGDLVQFQGKYIFQNEIDGTGDVEPLFFYLENHEALNKVWTTYINEVRKDHFFSNPFRSLTDLSLLFKTLVKIIELADIKGDNLPLDKFLYNATCLKTGSTIPFYDLSNEQIRLISITQIDS